MKLQENSIIEEIKQQEKRRCVAIVSTDLLTLRELLSDSLIHVHTRGNTDNLESYLTYVSTVVGFEKVLREEGMEIRIHGDTAITSGIQINHAYIRANPDQRAIVRSRVMQVWVKNNAGWQLAAFQATPLGDPPPAVSR